MAVSFNCTSGVITSLIWEISSLTVILFYYSGIPSSKYFIAVALAAAIGIVLVPFFGWLGDAALGRYRAIKYSILLVWLIIICNGIAEVFFYLYEIDNWVSSVIAKTVPFFVIIVSACAFVNTVHFGIDQIADSPSWQISSYISWYTWCFLLGYVIKSLTFECSSTILSTGFAALLLTIAICIDALGKQNLAISPTSSNSFKLIFSVLKYALRNKYPRASGSFSYWSKKNSRIDTAKRRYGGPFSNEDVEDVKTFFKVLALVIVGGFFPGVFITFTTFSGSVLMYHYRDRHYILHSEGISHFRHCLVRSFVYNATSYFAVVGLPIYQCIFHRWLWKYIASITISKRSILGVSFLFVTQISYLSLELVGHFAVASQNITIPCLLTSTQTNMIQDETVALSFYWLILPEVFSALAYYFLLTSAMEFLCSQSPYSMKSLMVGCMWSLFSLPVLAGIGIGQVFSVIGNTLYIPCGVLYFIFSSIATFLLVIIVSLVMLWYSKRRRRDNMEEECISVG